MQDFRTFLKTANKSIVTAVLTLFILHFLSIHSLANALVICFEANGDVNIESVAGSVLTIPAEHTVHAKDHDNHAGSSISFSHSHHKDVAFSEVCSKEQRTTRYDQQRTLAYLDGILNTAINELPRARVFQLASFIPPLIEDFVITNLQTVVLLN